MPVPAERSAYTAELRILVCSNCGAPVDVAVQGGLVRCEFCSAQAHVPARAQLHAAVSPEASRLPESERLRRLRAQEDNPLLPPPGIAHLFGPGGTVPAWRLQDVYAQWESARRRTAQGEPDAAEELVFLNVSLGNELIRSHESTKHRALLESALEAFSLPRHRSIVAAELCLGACRKGDKKAAEAWLALTDPASDDLYADSYFRLASAGVAFSKHDYEGMLTALGATNSDTPLHDAFAATVAVHQAHAWERLGRLDLATKVLTRRMTLLRRDYEEIRGIVENTGMCPQSFPQAVRLMRVKRWTKIALAALPLLLGVGILFGTVGVSAWSERSNAPDSNLWFLGAMLGAMLLIAGAVLVSAVVRRT